MQTSVMLVGRRQKRNHVSQLALPTIPPRSFRVSSLDHSPPSFFIFITPFGSEFWSDEFDIPILHTHMLKETNTIYQIEPPSGLEGLHQHGQRSRLRRKD